MYVRIGGYVETYVLTYTHQNLSIVDNLGPPPVCPYYRGLLLKYPFTPQY